MLRKLLLIPVFAILCICPLFQASAVNKAVISNVNVVTRIDTTKPFVRTVIELSAPVKPKIAVENTGKYITVSLPYTGIKSNVPTTYKTNKKIISQLTLAHHVYATDVNIKVPTALSKNDIRVFTLPNDVKNHRPNRVVIDINDRSGSVKPWSHWKEQEDDQNSGVVPVQETTFKIPQGNTTHNFSTQPGLRGKIICIDPGHGGTDSGALGVFSKEKDITLKISKYLQALLEKSGAKVIMTRTNDIDVYAPNDGAVEELQARCDIANNAHADAFVCIHIDSFSSSDASGVTAYYNDKTPYDFALAKYIHTENMKFAPSQDRGVKTANFYVLLHTDMPATLLELGFISNPNEERRLNSPALEQEYAGSILDGLAKYFQNASKQGNNS